MNIATTIRPAVYKKQSRARGHQVNERTSFENNAHIPITKRTLNTADPMIVPNPASLSSNVAKILVKSSGAEPPAAISVAPATSGEMLSFSAITSRAGTKKLITDDCQRYKDIHDTENCPYNIISRI